MNIIMRWLWPLGGLSTDSCTFSSDGLETGLDTGHRAARAACLTLQEEEARVFL